MSIQLKPVHFHDSGIKEIRDWSQEAKQEFGTVLLRLQRGELAGMPDVKPMPTVSKGVYEIRISTATAASRAFYIAMQRHVCWCFMHL